MKYYGERTKKLYDTVEACERAEFEAKEKENREKIEKERKEREANEKKELAIAQRKAAAEKVDAARKALADAREVCNKAEENLRKELADFCSKYGTYHFSSDKVEDFLPNIFDWKDWLSTFLKF